jgi:membrane-bound lytic murein transglycosylase MltF
MGDENIELPFVNYTRMKIRQDIITIIGIILFGIGIFVMRELEYNQQLQLELDCEFSGMLINKFIDNDDHGNKVIILNNQQKESLFRVPKCYVYISIGDSIVKKKGEVRYTVFKGQVRREFYPVMYGRNTELIK